jgi:dipeptide/tripeptide permease
MLQIAGGILLAVGAIYGVGFMALWLLALITRARPSKPPEQIAEAEAAYKRRRRLAYRIVFSVLGVWAIIVGVSMLLAWR